MILPRVSFFCALSLCAASALLAQQGTVTLLEPLEVPGTGERTMSESGQFVVYGPDGMARSSFTNQAEKIREVFGEILDLEEDDWHYQIVIQVHEPRDLQVVARHVVPKVYPLESGGYRIQMDLLNDRDLDPSEFRQELLRLLVMEQMVHSHQEINPHGKQKLLPDWVVYGLEELVIYDMDGRPSDVFTSLVEAQEPPTLEELLNTNPEQIGDSVNQSIYRACAGALVQALLDQKDGEKRFLAFLEDLAVSAGSELVTLKTHFGAMRNSGESLDKWWALQLALMSQRTTYQYLSIRETEEQLLSALVVRLKAPEEEAENSKRGLLNRVSRAGSELPLVGRRNERITAFQSGTFADHEQFVKDSRASEALYQNRQMIIQLSHRAHPLYREILAGYDQVAVRLSQGKTDRVGRDLAELEKMRMTVQERSEKVTDYMNWYDTTQIQSESGAFDRYERTLEKVEKMEDQTREDPISSYLDEVERTLR